MARALMAFDDSIHLFDGFPLPICQFRRAKRTRCFRGEAAYGYCSSKDEKYYGFKGHLLINLDGVITAFTVTLANSHERDAVPDLKYNNMGY